MEHCEERCSRIMEQLCSVIPERCVGSPGNRKATSFFEAEARRSGWHTESHEMDVMGWNGGNAALSVSGKAFAVKASPYSPGCLVEAPLICASSLEELRATDAYGKVLLLHGGLAREQIMPKNFVFYNPEHHRALIEILEEKQPAAILCATGRNSALAGGVYPFPLIEDGDFNIPSVYMTEEEGARLLPFTGGIAHLESQSVRIPEKAFNVIACRGNARGKRVVVTAHIDAKTGTPGAIDNATGVAVMLLLAELLADYQGDRLIELAALNGEDYYAVPGQMQYIGMNRDRFGDILLNINIDGAGYRDGNSSFSFFGLPKPVMDEANRVLELFPEIVEGPQWPQGDHSIFVQMGCPALAVSSMWLITNMDTQDVTHTGKDNPGIVDCGKVVGIARALDMLIRGL
ncbi:MAG: M28 family peptidase [Candidatus Fermentibacteraceae bacterium]